MAVERAAKKSRENGWSAKNRYLQSDIASYAPSDQFDRNFMTRNAYYANN